LAPGPAISNEPAPEVTRRLIPRLWQGWLVVALAGTIACSVLPLLAPGTARRLLSALVFGQAAQADALPAAAVQYITFINCAVGAAMVGWAAALLFIAAGPFGRGERWAWQAVTASLLAWFVPGTLLWLWLGVMLNVAINVAFIAVFAVPLLAARRHFHAVDAYLS